MVSLIVMVGFSVWTLRQRTAVQLMLVAAGAIGGRVVGWRVPTLAEQQAATALRVKPTQELPRSPVPGIRAGVRGYKMLRRRLQARGKIP